MRFVTLPLFAAAAFALVAPAIAQQGQAPTPEQRAARFDAGDKDKDGKLTKAEFAAQLPEQAQPMAEQIWARLDPNNAGFVTKEQYLAAQPMQRPQ